MMCIKKSSKNLIKYICVAIAVCISTSATYVSYIANIIPDEITIYNNQPYEFDKLGLFNNFFTIEAEADTTGVLAKSGELETGGDNTYSASINIGGIKIKDVKVKKSDSTYLIPMGYAIGVKLFCPGVLITEICSFKGEKGDTLTPARGSGLKPGDLIYEVDGEKISTVKDLTSKLNKGATSVSITYKRDNSSYSCVSLLQKDENGVLRMGLIVKDSAAGVGTLTYINPHTGEFGALGHGVSDPDTNRNIPLLKGSADYATVVNVVKGEKGIPGEMHGMFTTPFGKIHKNCDRGIFGKTENNDFASLTPVKIAGKNEISTGRAQILCTVEGTSPQLYEVAITDTATLSLDATKGMIIEITDPGLIEKTGGIIQGMSGSPIIQNGKLVGAVTHVFVNDPTRGYGIFIENMLAEAEKIK